MTTTPVPVTQADLSPEDFKRIARIARSEAGLALSENKCAMIAGRVAKRLRATGAHSIATYLDALESPDGAAERRKFIGVLTTNVSHFFREAHHFELLEREVLPPLIARARRGGRVRIWSAGCSTGQEPYSIAMSVLRQAPDAGNLDLRILATDIDDEVLSTAAEGNYDETQLARVDPKLRAAFFEKHGSPQVAVCRAGQALRSMIRFRHLNLIARWPISGPFDAIFCRNVVIYFDAATQAALWPRFESMLAPEGCLFLGHSERLGTEVQGMFRSVGLTAYRKTGQTTSAGKSGQGAS